MWTLAGSRRPCLHFEEGSVGRYWETAESSLTQCVFLTFVCMRPCVCVCSCACVYCPKQGTESEAESFYPKYRHKSVTHGNRIKTNHPSLCCCGGLGRTHFFLRKCVHVCVCVCIAKTESLGVSYNSQGTKEDQKHIWLKLLEVWKVCASIPTLTHRNQTPKNWVQSQYFTQEIYGAVAVRKVTQVYRLKYIYLHLLCLLNFTISSTFYLWSLQQFSQLIMEHSWDSWSNQSLQSTTAEPSFFFFFFFVFTFSSPPSSYKCW